MTTILRLDTQDFSLRGMNKLEKSYEERFRNAGVMIPSDTLYLETMKLDIEYFDDDFDGMGKLKGRGKGEITPGVTITEHGATFAPDGFGPTQDTNYVVPFLFGLSGGLILGMFQFLL